jgi:hypothetical protein
VNVLSTRRRPNLAGAGRRLERDQHLSVFEANNFAKRIFVAPESVSSTAKTLFIPTLDRHVSAICADATRCRSDRHASLQSGSYDGISQFMSAKPAARKGCGQRNGGVIWQDRRTVMERRRDNDLNPVVKLESLTE